MCYFCAGLGEYLWRGCAFGTFAWRAVCRPSARAQHEEGDVSVSHFHYIYTHYVHVHYVLFPLCT